MKTKVVFEMEIEVEVPDTLPEAARKLKDQRPGEDYLADKTDKEILERIALIRGIRKLPLYGGLSEILNNQVQVEIVGEKVIWSYRQD